MSKADSLLLRLPSDLKQRIVLAAEKMNRLHPGAKYSVVGLVRVAAREYVEKVEQIKEGESA